MSKPNLTVNREAELAVISALQLRVDAIDDVRHLLEADDFYTPGYRAVYAASLLLASEGHPIDIVTLERQLRASDELGLVGGLEGLSKLTDRHVGSHNVVQHAELVREAKRRRVIVQEAQDLIDAVREDGEQHAGELAESAASTFGRLAGGRRKLRTGGELAQMACDQADARFRGEVDSEPISTGLTQLNDALGGGLEPATLIVVCARPGNGKTALTTSWQLTMGRAGDAIYGQQMDMGGVQTGRRLIAVAAPLHLKSIKHPKKTATLDAMRAAQQEIASLALTFDTRKVTAREARAQIREWRRKHAKRRGAVFIDYVQLHRMEGSGKDRHDLDLAEICGEYKDLAEELEIPVVLLSQLNRKVEDRDDKRPRMSDVRDCGQIEEIADVILGLYREARYNPEADKLAAEILVLKHRDEAPRTGSEAVQVHFEPWFTRFIDAPEYTDQQKKEKKDAQDQKRTKRYRSPHRYADSPD